MRTVLRILKGHGFMAFFIFVLVGCSQSSLNARQNTALNIADQSGFDSVFFPLPNTIFSIQGYQRISNPLDPNIKIYIEGDGFAFISGRQISPDPTPRHPLAFQLAAMDQHENIVYLARPCQYQAQEKAGKPQCDPKYWTTHRYAPEIINAYNVVLDNIKKNKPERYFSLTGYSGGGGIAAILAAMRSDIHLLQTVAGNLDIQAFTKYHNVTPLSGSLNPAHYAHQNIHIPQCHYVGERDEVIPVQLSDYYFAHHASALNSRREIVQDATHTKGWKKFWETNSNKCSSQPIAEATPR